MPRRHTEVAALIAVLAATVAGALAAPAAAVPPGQNGPIAFSGLVDGNRQVFVVNPDGSFLSQVTDDPAGAGAIVWFPGGTRLAYMTLRS